MLHLPLGTGQCREGLEPLLFVGVAPHVLHDLVREERCISGGDEWSGRCGGQGLVPREQVEETGCLAAEVCLCMDFTGDKWGLSGPDAVAVRLGLLYISTAGAVVRDPMTFGREGTETDGTTLWDWGIANGFDTVTVFKDCCLTPGGLFLLTGLEWDFCSTESDSSASWVWDKPLWQVHGMTSLSSQLSPINSFEQWSADSFCGDSVLLSELQLLSSRVSETSSSSWDRDDRERVVGVADNTGCLFDGTSSLSWRIHWSFDEGGTVPSSPLSLYSCTFFLSSITYLLKRKQRMTM